MEGNYESVQRIIKSEQYYVRIMEGKLVNGCISNMWNE